MIETVIVFSKIFNEFSEPIFIKDTKGIFIYCNKAFGQAFNLSVDQIIGTTIFELIPKRFALLCHQLDQKIMLEGGSQKFRLTIKKSIHKRINIFCTAIRDENGPIKGIFGYFEESTNKQLIHAPKNNLTNRETEILLLMSSGKSTKAIALHLCISHHTVVHHQKKIYLKLNANSKINAIIKARDRGIIKD